MSSAGAAPSGAPEGPIIDSPTKTASTDQHDRQSCGVARTARRFRRVYLTALLVLAALVIVDKAVLHSLLVDMESDASRINIAGRQRMLSQRIAAKSSRLAHALGRDEPAEVARLSRELNEAADLWRTSHEQLLAWGTATGVGHQEPAAVQAQYDGLQPHFDAINAALGQFLDARPSTATPADAVAAANEIEWVCDAFLAAMNGIVFDHDREATAKVATLEAIGLGLSVLLLLALVAEALLFFEPCIRRFDRLQQAAGVHQEALADTQARLRRATAGSANGLWEYELATGRAWYSEQLKELLGVRPGEHDDFAPVLDSLTDRLHPLDRPAAAAALEAHLEDDAPYDLEYRLRTEGDQYRWFRARGQASRDDTGQASHMAGSLADVHDHHTAASRLDLAVRAAQIGLWDWDVSSGETYFSDMFYTMLGYEPGELPMTLDTWMNLTHPDDLQGALADIQRHLDGTSPIYANEHRLRCRDGSWRWIRDTGEIVERNEDGSARRMIGVHIDVQALRESAEEATAANLAKSEFLANMSHEIRTPMTAILGYVDLLDGDEDLASDPAEAQAAVKTIRSNARHLLAILNDILDMSKVEAGRMSVEHIDTSPARVVEEVASLMGPRAIGKGIDLRVRYDTPIPECIQSDHTRLRQILLNLVGNAVKFTETGNVVIQASCQPEAGLMIFSVVDTGIGLTPEQCRTLERFDAFTQADTSTTRQFGGTGLGLRISNSLARLLGGRITIDSIRGQGSTFTVTIATGPLEGVAFIAPDRVPSLAEMERWTGGEQPTGDDTLQGVRILLAEDGPDNQRLISFHLRKAGAEVIVAENGRIACELIEGASEESRPDVLLTDMQMPELDGYGAARRLRGAGHTLPIIALTAHAMDEDRRKCLDAGCDDFLTKPIDRPKLIATCCVWAARGTSGKAA